MGFHIELILDTLHIRLYKFNKTSIWFIVDAFLFFKQIKSNCKLIIFQHEVVSFLLLLQMLRHKFICANFNLVFVLTKTSGFNYWCGIGSGATSNLKFIICVSLTKLNAWIVQIMIAACLIVEIVVLSHHHLSKMIVRITKSCFALHHLTTFFCKLKCYLIPVLKNIAPSL